MSWTADDRMVAGLCDGDAQPWPNVPHRPFNSRLISIRGIPPQDEFDDTPGYPELLVGPGPRNVSRYYGFGILSLNGAIYQFISTPDPEYRQKLLAALAHLDQLQAEADAILADPGDAEIAAWAEELREMQANVEEKLDRLAL